MTAPISDSDIILSARAIGALFTQPPDSEAAAPLVAAFTDGSWEAQWPSALPYRPQVAAGFRTADAEPLAEAWQRLFVGPYALPAPPWGSVWLDREKVLFGDSTLALRQWMRESGIAFDSGQNEPEDHFGLLLLLSAWLLESGQQDRWQELMAWHLLPWGVHFLQAFTARAGHPFYCALGQLAEDAIAAWRTRLLMPVAEKKIWP